MNGREAVKALIEGNILVGKSGTRARFSVERGVETTSYDKTYWKSPGPSFLDNMYSSDGWELFQEPLSDDQLVEQWLFMARQTAIAAGFAGNRCSSTYEECARQLRERKL